MNALLVSHRASSAVWVATSVHRQPFVPLHRATALCGCLYASLHNDFVRPLSCILCTFMNALLVSHPCETLGVHFIRHPCLTRKLRVLPPAAPKIIPRLLSGRKCSGVVESCLLCWFRIVRNFGQALSRILAFAVIGVGASLRRQPFVPLHRATALCGCLYASLRNFGRPFYKASMPYPQVAGSPTRRTKNNTPLVERAKV